MNARRIFLTLGGAGLSPKAPGTVGTIVAAFLAIPVLLFLSTTTLFLLALLIGVIAIKVIDKEELKGAKHDAQEIVVDELVGVWIALSMVTFEPYSFCLAVIFFRIFDIWKPSIIKRIDQNAPGGIGVVGDDALAGFFAGLMSLMMIELWSRFL